VIALLARLAKMEGELQELRSRTHAIQYATVTAIDPDRRRIKVSREAQGGQIQSDWIPAGRSSSHTDEPLPQPGTTVLVALIEGNTHNMALLRTISNDTNPPDPSQKTPDRDNTTEIPGDDRATILGNHRHEVAGDESRETDGKVEILVNGETFSVNAAYGKLEFDARTSITFKNQAGASLTLGSAGWVQLSDKWGHTLTLGGLNGSAGNIEWDLNGAEIDVVNANGFTINGVSVLTIGSVDTRGDSNITRGY
jgi:phage baseplate assembly protein gpV